jgi:hypothetical protein
LRERRAGEGKEAKAGHNFHPTPWTDNRSRL